MKKVIKLTEADLTRIVKRVIEEQPEEVGDNILINRKNYQLQKNFGIKILDKVLIRKNIR